jgi:cell division protein FtsI/penicillin-binding protein 2
MLKDGRVGTHIEGMDDDIRDDEKDKHPHGDVDLIKATVHSCNAYYSQLGVKYLSARELIDTAELFGIALARPNTVEEVAPTLPYTAYGQGEILSTPLEMTTVAATIANGGVYVPPTFVAARDMYYRTYPGTQVITEEHAAALAGAMRRVVSEGTARPSSKKKVSPGFAFLAGKTGTAEIDNKPSHAWFVGFAPYIPATWLNPNSPRPRQLAITVFLEHGGYGGMYAAPIAARVANAAERLGLIRVPQPPERALVLEKPTQPRSSSRR